ncbi:MAG: NADH dehydrogenase (quinone), multicomponent Na+:H+ antiporter subunit A [Chloroflexi bacterium CSP1-4]|nr:MAG: NADH dehydrogenase (quinone), multicomponent Na+:H+ antiporter subunit A [Chloroflexi bacterium CSP1-4]
MALLALLIVAAAGTAGTFLARGRAGGAPGVGIAALAGFVIAAVAMPADATLAVGAAQLVVTPYARLWLIAAAVALLAVELVSRAHGGQRNLPFAALGGLGAAAVALTVTDGAAAILAATAAGCLGLVATLGGPITMPTLRVSADGLRSVAVAGAGALLAVAWIGDDAIFLSSGAVAAGVLLMAAALALRLGAVPFHVPLARLVGTARLAAVPLAAAWLPAAFAIVALGWAQLGPAPVAGDLTGPRLIVALVAVVTIFAAGVVAILDDDLARVLGYGLVADGGFVLLALAGADPAVWPAARTWLLCLALSRTVMALAILGLEGADGTRHGRELHGWLRRTPSLGIALAVAVLVGIGLPGMLPFEARRTLAVLAVGEPLGALVLVLGALPLLPLARLAWVGAQAPGPAVAAGRSERPVMLPADEREAPTAWRARARQIVRRAALAWQLDRVPIASAVTGLLALAALAVALGVGGLAEAAAGRPPGAGPLPGL